VKYIFVLLTLLFILPIVSASINDLGPVKQNTCVSLPQTCNCTYNNITTIILPDKTYATITKVMTAKDEITVWGAGEEARDLLYVEDLSDFVQKAIEKQKNEYELFNCGAGVAVKIKDLVKLIVQKSGKKIEIKHDLSQPSIPTSLFLDCTKAKKLLGWSPTIKLNEGVAKTLNWYGSNINV
jgi:nucleoside-diphosphate-sugar epimerase